MKRIVDEQVHLTEFQTSDKAALAQLLNDRRIYDNTLRIPYPYTEAHAEQWFGLAKQMTEKQGRPVNWAIREANGTLIGGCGLDGSQLVKGHRGEIGYWLGPPYWGRGIMTAVVASLCQLAFEDFDLVKITAAVFAGNTASVRVLQKCGFEQEGFVRKHYLKDGRFIDAHLMARLR
jgi:RimJ/RimL family protein N-acetyltransferase